MSVTLGVRDGGLSFSDEGDFIVDGIAQDGRPSAFADLMAKLLDGHPLGGCGTRVVINFLVDDRAINVVGSEPLGDLGLFDAEHDPVGLDVGDIVEKQARGGKVTQLVEAAWAGQMRERGVLGMKRKGDEALETRTGASLANAPPLVLVRAQAK